MTARGKRFEVSELVGRVAPERYVGEVEGGDQALAGRNRSGTRDFGLEAEAIDGRRVVPRAMHWHACRLDSRTRFHRQVK